MKISKRLTSISAALLLATQLAVLTLVQPAQAVSSSSTCASTVVIAARGTGEANGSGRAWSVTKAVRDGFKTTVRTDYLSSSEYPATAANYPWSVSTGEKNLRAKLGRLVDKCPGTWVVLVGYSQGAHVIGDTIDVRGTQLSAKVKNRIKAIVLLGDPTFRANQNYSAGTYDKTKSGVFRRPAGDFGSLATRVKSYCNKSDMFCQNNPTGGEAAKRAHADYDKYTKQAFDFVKSRY